MMAETGNHYRYGNGNMAEQTTTWPLSNHSDPEAISFSHYILKDVDTSNCKAMISMIKATCFFFIFNKNPPRKCETKFDALQQGISVPTHEANYQRVAGCNSLMDLLQTNIQRQETHHHHQQWHNSPLWAKAFLRSFCHPSLCLAALLLCLSPNFLASPVTPSSHLNLGLPFCLLPSRQVTKGGKSAGRWKKLKLFGEGYFFQK